MSTPMLYKGVLCEYIGPVLEPLALSKVQLVEDEREEHFRDDEDDSEKDSPILLFASMPIATELG